MTHRWDLRGTSMYPFGTGWQADVAPRRLRRGDMVVYLDAAGRTLGHRVHGVTDELVYVRGDTVGPEPPVPLGAVIGRVVGLRRGRLHISLEEGTVADKLFRRGGLAWARLVRALEPLRAAAAPRRRKV